MATGFWVIDFVLYKGSLSIQLLQLYFLEPGKTVVKHTRSVYGCRERLRNDDREEELAQ